MAEDSAETIDVSDWPGHERGSTGYKRLLLALFFAGIATFAQLYSPQAALPQIAAELGVSAAGSALLISMATLGLAVGVVPWSIAADRFGRVPTMSFAIVAATTCGILVPFAPTFTLLLTGRFVEGLMVGAVPAVAVAYLTEEVSPTHTARAAGIYVAGTTIGGLLGRIVAGPVADVATWRIGVLSVALLCAVAAGLFIALAPRSRGFVPRRSSDLDASEQVMHRLLANLRSPRQLAMYAQGFLLMGGFVAMYNFLGFRLGSAPFNLPQTVISFIFVAYLAGTWSSATAGAIASKHGRLPVLLGGIAIMVVGVALTLTNSLALVLVGLVLATAGFFAAHAIASGWTAHEAPVGRAQASSLYNLSYYAGSSVFGWLGGVFYASDKWPGTVAMIGGLALLSALLAAVLLRRRTSPLQ